MSVDQLEEYIAAADLGNLFISSLSVIGKARAGALIAKFFSEAAAAQLIPGADLVFDILTAISAASAILNLANFIGTLVTYPEVEAILLDGKKGRNRTFGVPVASSCKRERCAPSPTKTRPTPSCSSSRAAVINVSQAP